MKRRRFARLLVQLEGLATGSLNFMGTPTHFAGATPTILRRAERVRSAAPHITSSCGCYAYEPPLRRALRSTTLRTLCGRYANETPPRRARSIRGIRPHPRITLRELLLRLSAAPSMLLFCLRIWSRPLRHRTPTHYIHIQSLNPTHKFEFQLFDSTL